jgi:phospholipase C
MDGFVTDYISTFTSEVGRQPSYEEYAQIMSCYTPEQVPVLNGIAKPFGVFDHWFSDVPSQTFMNRSFRPGRHRAS